MTKTLEIDVSDVVREDEDDLVLAPVAGGLDGSGDADAVVREDDPADIPVLPRGAVEQADGSVILTLDRPVNITFQNSRGTRRETVSTLQFYRLTGAHLTEITNAAERVRERVAFALSLRKNKASTNGIFDRMDAADIARASRVLEYFLGSGPASGRS
ncbi:hypothetical protein [Pannonibacter indicus]|uniref:hypothetical protein n=1 Tax=Pannonibacter indicus TaxID=466044 RepID=UPI003918D9CA